MEECYKMLTDQIDWANPEGDQVRIDISRPLPFSGPPGHVTIQTQFFFNKDLENLRYGSKGCGQALSISKMKDACYHEFGLELLVPEHMWIYDVCTYDISASYEKDFKNLYPSNFEDLNLLLLQGHFNHLFGSDKRFKYKHGYTIIETPHAVVFPIGNNERKIMRFNEIYKFSDGTLTNILEALDYRVKEYKVNRLYPGTSRMTNNQAFTIKKGMSMPVQMSPAQDGKRPKVNDQRLDLADDLKEAQDHISSTITSHKAKITTSMYKISHEESKTTI
ncbi:hypothetical protein Tco_0688541 [Tanacetum coccineum]